MLTFNISMVDTFHVCSEIYDRRTQSSTCALLCTGTLVSTSRRLSAIRERDGLPNHEQSERQRAREVEASLTLRPLRFHAYRRGDCGFRATVPCTVIREHFLHRKILFLSMTAVGTPRPGPPEHLSICPGHSLPFTFGAYGSENVTSGGHDQRNCTSLRRAIGEVGDGCAL